ncbi:hypothetical protein A6E15_12615 [Natrinema saccharevitans]|uniref:Uncharacterized protein n=1 Tax=Natrinema saccharevitans TaxID=301967 RepID=A0A1S8AYU9_9EURY|nr:hypothetical protein [Natrinema saccharevitans]OLZ41777.1 hypothetical protein A6E15_12615 [Natrinema saccharevitans]
MPAELSRTHRLECEGFATEFRALLELVLPDTTTAVVRLREDEMETNPDGEDCRRTWNAVRDRLERVPERDRNGATAWRVSTTTDPGREALFELVALTDGIAGAHFVWQLECRDEGTAVLEAIPHHSDARIDATLLGAEIQPGDIAGLRGHDACLVPTGCQFEWVAEDRQWRIEGGSLCIETLDGRKATCYGLTNLEQATITDDGTVLALVWEPGELPDDAVGKLLSWIMDKLYTPPPALPCETAERATAVKTHLQELVVAYDGREI